MTWRDISTAPRDGTDILVFDADELGLPDTACCTVVRWYGGEWAIVGYGGPIVEEDGWVRTFMPTHWMPLPDPPVTTTEADRIAVMDGK